MNILILWVSLKLKVLCLLKCQQSFKSWVYFYLLENCTYIGFDTSWGNTFKMNFTPSLDTYN